jgi:putative salt-induced outer membrane protein YdiY
MRISNPYLSTGSIAAMLRTSLLAIVLLASAFASGANAQAPQTPNATDTANNFALPDLSWVPPEDGYDWVQLKSGEWLKGTVKAMQERDLEFDSEEMDYQTFEWRDIRQLRSGRMLQIKLINGENIFGRINVTPSEMTVRGLAADSPGRTVPRDQIQSFTRAGSHERDYWTGDISLGLSMLGGNTDQTDYNGQGHLQRRTPATRLTIDYIGNLSETGETETARNTRVNGSFDVWMTQHFYLVVPSFEVYADPYQNIARRMIGGVGFGYDIIDRPTLEWNISTGPGYLETKFVSTQVGESQTTSAFALGLSSRFEWDVTKDVELTLEYRGQFTSKEAGETTHHTVSGLSIDLTKRLSVDLSFTWDRITQPKPDASGVTPERDDYRLVFGLGLEF